MKNYYGINKTIQRQPKEPSMMVEAGLETTRPRRGDERTLPDPSSMMARVSIRQDVANGTYFKSYLFEIRNDSTGLIYVDTALTGERPHWELQFQVRSRTSDSTRVLARLAEWAQAMVSSERSFAAKLHGAEPGNRSGFEISWDFDCNRTFSI